MAQVAGPDPNLTEYLLLPVARPLTPPTSGLLWILKLASLDVVGVWLIETREVGIGVTPDRPTSLEVGVGSDPARKPLRVDATKRIRGERFLPVIVAGQFRVIAV